ncbi:hypothetical protein ILT44_25160 [Microvirga sp. BT689]|uniref:hypothetical protein n=1 Tax=Microvirga arvi TaxID=2778731 RepID=UPI00195009CE|nr:hypothetical protein [Microvirga arvi]MBM6583495.1 hypothetical protein [Microvirga arvi]
MSRRRPSFSNIHSRMRVHQKSHDLGQVRVNFATVKTAALPLVPAVVKRWLPDGRQEAAEWVVRNPRRDDR